MIFGFNTDVKFGNTVYHVQSEARKNERLLQSQVFVKGRCIGKRATSYAEKEDEAGLPEEELHELLKQQHRHFVEAVRAGRIEEELDSEPTEVVSAAAAATAPAPAVAPVPTASRPEAAPETTKAVDELLAELRAANPPGGAGAAPADDTLAAEFAAAVADKPADAGLALAPISGVIGKGLSVECLPPACTPDNSAVLVTVQVVDDGGVPASGAQITCRITGGVGPATYAYATTGGTGIADLRIALAGLNLAATSLLVQASYREKSASRKYTLRRSA